MILIDELFIASSIPRQSAWFLVPEGPVPINAVRTGGWRTASVSSKTFFIVSYGAHCARSSATSCLNEVIVLLTVYFGTTIPFSRVSSPVWIQDLQTSNHAFLYVTLSHCRQSREISQEVRDGYITDHCRPDRWQDHFLESSRRFHHIFSPLVMLLS